MQKKLLSRSNYLIFLIDPKDKETCHKLSKVFARAGQSLGYNTIPLNNSPCGACDFVPKEDMLFTEIEGVLQRTADELQTPVAVSMAKTIRGEDIRFFSYHNEQDTIEQRRLSQAVAMDSRNLLIEVAPNPAG